MRRNKGAVKPGINCFNGRYGQANIVMMVLVLMMVFAMFFFLLQLLQKPPESALDNLYVHNMLLSIMRTDTGYNESNCKTVSDAIACYFFEPQYNCDGRIPCKVVAESRIQELLHEYGNVRKNRRFYFEVEAERKVISHFGVVPEMKIGDPSVEDNPQKITANEKVQKISMGEVSTINVRLCMAEREAG